MIRTALSHLLARMARWLKADRTPGILDVPMGPPLYVDAFRQHRAPTATELLADLKGTAWACATLNASACAAHPPRLYAVTRPGQPRPRCLTRALPPPEERRLRDAAHLRQHTCPAEQIEEVTEHPLLDLLRQVNPTHNAFDLWELTTLYQEATGCAYWYVEDGPLGLPAALWPLPSHHVTPQRRPDSPDLVDAYVYRAAGREERFSPSEIIAFRYPDPYDPYSGGLSPLRACFEQVALASHYSAFRRAKFENHAVPDALVCPDTVLGEDERDRLEQMWNARLRRGGTGRVVVAESGLRVQLLAHTMGDLAALADAKATREEIANAFGVPLAYLTTETNLANLQAAEQQHAARALLPRLRRRDEKLNEQLVPRYDPTGRLFLATDDPTPTNREQAARERELYLKYGVVTVNEVRSDLGLPPVPWGDAKAEDQRQT